MRLLLLLLCVGAASAFTWPTSNNVKPTPTTIPSPLGYYDYREALEKAIMFFESQKSGLLPATNRIPWRRSSGLNDKGDDGYDLTGGWYEAGNTMKFMFPLSAICTFITWGIIENEKGYKLAGQYEYAIDIVKWELDFILKCANRAASDGVVVAQVSNPDIEFEWWGRSEDMECAPGYTVDSVTRGAECLAGKNESCCFPRPVFLNNPQNPGSDIGGEMAAALAAGAVLFNKLGDQQYANQLIEVSKEVYTWAETYKGFYHTSVPGAKDWYPSTNYTDELIWGAAWIYRATGDRTYLTKARNGIDNDGSCQFDIEFSWDNKCMAVQLLMYIIEDGLNQAKFRNKIKDILDAWLPIDKRVDQVSPTPIIYSPKGMAFFLDWGSLAYPINMAQLFTIARKYLKDRSQCGAGTADVCANYLFFARQQIHYVLGDAGHSYMVGYGYNPPLRPHHPASTCPPSRAFCMIYCKDSDCEGIVSPLPNPVVVHGAIVGGPSKPDDVSWTDYRADYHINEVSDTYNGCFLGAISFLISELGQGCGDGVCTADEAPGLPYSCPLDCNAPPTTPAPSTTTKPPITTGAPIGDFTPPVLRCPVDVNLLGSPSNAPKTADWLTTCVDNVDGIHRLAFCTPDGPYAFSPGTTVINCTCSDLAGNVGTCGFRISVLGTSCGNNICEAQLGEDCNTCNADCGSCAKCGDSICQSGESCGTCSEDCICSGSPAPRALLFKLEFSTTRPSSDAAQQTFGSQLRTDIALALGMSVKRIAIGEFGPLSLSDTFTVAVTFLPPATGSSEASAGKFFETLKTQMANVYSNIYQGEVSYFLSNPNQFPSASNVAAYNCDGTLSATPCVSDSSASKSGFVMYAIYGGAGVGALLLIAAVIYAYKRHKARKAKEPADLKRIDSVDDQTGLANSKSKGSNVNLLGADKSTPGSPSSKDGSSVNFASKEDYYAPSSSDAVELQGITTVLADPNDPAEIKRRQAAKREAYRKSKEGRRSARSIPNRTGSRASNRDEEEEYQEQQQQQQRPVSRGGTRINTARSTASTTAKSPSRPGTARAKSPETSSTATGQKSNRTPAGGQRSSRTPAATGTATGQKSNRATPAGGQRSSRARSPTTDNNRSNSRAGNDDDRSGTPAPGQRRSKTPVKRPNSRVVDTRAPSVDIRADVDNYDNDE